LPLNRAIIETKDRENRIGKAVMPDITNPGKLILSGIGLHGKFGIFN